ncbi:hypothetical protein BASA83_012146 [Batrachochytrium salamandrivorans]|nr:hypothetical protein BASA83_012146 [Batrachochytrium salamandrivorans]
MTNQACPLYLILAVVWVLVLIPAIPPFTLWRSRHKTLDPDGSFKHITSYFVFRGESRGSFQAAMALYIPAHFAIPIASSMVAFIPSNTPVRLFSPLAMCISCPCLESPRLSAYVSVIVLITESASGTGH